MESVLPHIDSVDMVLVMTVAAGPGVKGQEVMNNVHVSRKVEALQKERPDLLVKTDGWDEVSLR